MERLLVGDEYLALENEEMALLKYYVVEGRKEVEGTNEKKPTYGLEIEKWTKQDVERNVVYDVTTQKERAFEMMDTLKENKLMPVHLRDVVMDMIWTWGRP